MPTEIKYNNVLLFLSNTVLYMIKCGQLIKELYSNIGYTTCFFHALYTVSDDLRGQFLLIDELKSKEKRKKAKQNIFKNMASDILLPYQPIMT